MSAVQIFFHVGIFSLAALEHVKDVWFNMFKESFAFVFVFVCSKRVSIAPLEKERNN